MLIREEALLPGSHGFVYISGENVYLSLVALLIFPEIPKSQHDAALGSPSRTPSYLLFLRICILKE